MLKARIASVLLLSASLAACGTFVPEIQEFPANQAVDANELLVRAIVRSIHCELRNAITYVINQDKDVARLNHGIRSAPWLDKWGVQLALTLTMDEKTTVNPTATWTPPNPATALMSLAGGLTISADGKRIDKLNYYYTVKELYALGACPANDNAQAPVGSLLIQNDLKLKEWLLSQVLSVGTGEITVPIGIQTPLKQNALSHEVSFEVVSTGNITPAWKFTHVVVNQSGPLFTASRDRTHDLLMTFGPIDPTTKGLTGAAADSYLASQIAAAINNNRPTGF